MAGNYDPARLYAGMRRIATSERNASNTDFSDRSKQVREFFEKNDMGHFLFDGMRPVEYHELSSAQQAALGTFLKDKAKKVLRTRPHATRRASRGATERRLRTMTRRMDDAVNTAIQATAMATALAEASLPSTVNGDLYMQPGAREQENPSSLVGRKIRLAEDGRPYTVTGFKDRYRGDTFAGPTHHTVLSPGGSTRSIVLQRARTNPITRRRRTYGQAYTVHGASGSGKHRRRRRRRRKKKKN